MTPERRAFVDGVLAQLMDWLPQATGPETDALYLRQWLATIAEELFGIGQTGPLAPWGSSKRGGGLRFLEDLEDLGEAV